MVDAASLPLLVTNRWSWMPGPKGTNGYACVADEAKGWVKLARIVAGVTRRTQLVGHANDDTLDCRRANLVVSTRRAASRRSHKPRTFAGRPPSSSFKGVSRERSIGRWKASITVDGRRVTLGRFRDEIAAAEAYDEAARKHFGSAARLNFP